GIDLTGLILSQNYPNPFNSKTTIQYSLPGENTVTIVIYDLKGSWIKTLINDRQAVGVKTLLWNGKNDAGRPVPAGIYLYTMTSGNIITTRKMVYLK
ncbi:MAG: T9SS type A sorting domain-containing protein, partial [Candidatus Neomarinimicrobiota bacterium]|nr:T9SS type A sorting domain-containing protein [Candidatus Neomarinimicrobiota bacterium]